MEINSNFKLSITLFSIGIVLMIADVQACKVAPGKYFVKEIEKNILYINECNTEKCLEKKKQLEKRADIDKPYCLGYAQIDSRKKLIIVSSLECENVPAKFVGITWKDKGN